MKKVEEKQQMDKGPLITISSTEYEQLKEQGQLVLQMAAHLEVVERALKGDRSKGKSNFRPRRPR